MDKTAICTLQQGCMKIIYLIFSLLVQQVYSQPNAFDSLEKKLAISKVDTQQLALLKQLADMALRSNMEKALIYAKQGAAIADKTGDKYRLSQFYEMTGEIYFNLLYLDSATVIIGKAMAGYTSINNKRGQATTFLKMGSIYKKKGEMDKALDVDLKASGLMEALGDMRGVAEAYKHISGDLLFPGRITEAWIYAQKASEICEAYHWNDEMAYALSAKGDVKIAAGKYLDAYEYYNRALQLARKQHFDEISLTEFINNHGNALKQLGQFSEAISDYQTALSIARRVHYPNVIATTIANLGEATLLKGHYQEALQYQLETISMQENENDISNLTENYLHISSIYEHLGDYKLALAYHQKALLMRDSISSVRSNEAMSEMLAQYETKKKEATIVSQQKEILDQQKVQWLWVGLVILMTGFIILGIISYRIRLKRSRLLAAKNAENELLLKEIHHRVKNNLEVVSSLLALQSAQIDDPNTKEAILEGQRRVHSISIVHQKLYHGKNPGVIEMKDYFLSLSESVLDSFGVAKRISIQLAMNKLEVDIDTAVPLGLIVNELLTNAIKYAFPNGREGNVIIKLEKTTQGVLQLEVSDNGVGKSSVIQGGGFGTQLISLLTTQLGGKMREEVKTGTHTFFDLKILKAV